MKVYKYRLTPEAPSDLMTINGVILSKKVRKTSRTPLDIVSEFVLVEEYDTPTPKRRKKRVSSKVSEETTTNESDNNVEEDITNE